MYGLQGAWDNTVNFFGAGRQPPPDGPPRSSSSSAGARRGSSNRLTPLEKHARQPANQECADCGARDPEWASVNQGTTICMECAGVHRSLGTHISRVKSLGLDSWTPDEVQGFCAKGGNREVNRRLEREAGCTRPRPGAPRAQVDEYIARKYQGKLPAASRSSSSTSSKPASQNQANGASAKVGITAHQGLAIVEVLNVSLMEERVTYLKPLGALFLNLTAVVSLGGQTAEPTSAKWSSASAVWEPPERKQLLWDCEERWLYVRVNDLTISGTQQLAGEGRIDVREIQAEMQSWGEGEDMADVEIELYAPRDQDSDEEVEAYVEHVVEEVPSYPPGWAPPRYEPDNDYSGYNGRPRYVYNMRLLMMRIPSDHRRYPPPSQAPRGYPPPDMPPAAPGMETFVVGFGDPPGGYGHQAKSSHQPNMYGGYSGHPAGSPHPAGPYPGGYGYPPDPYNYYNGHPEGMSPVVAQSSDPAAHGVLVGTARIRLTLIDMSGMTTQQERKTVGDGAATSNGQTL